MFVLFCFLQFFSLQLTSNLIALWPEKILDMISVFLNLLRLGLWPSRWSIIENVPCALVKNVYFVLSDEILYKYQFSFSGIMCHLRPVVILIDFLFE